MTRNEAHQDYRFLSQYCKTAKDKNTLARKLCLTDLFFLLVYVLGREDCDRDWIYERVREVEASPDGHLDLWAREHYKLQRLDEPTATPEGWKLHGELVPGDIIFGADGTPCKVIALNKIVTDARCYEIEFDDGFKIQAGAEHLWCVEKKTRKRVRGTKNGRIYREEARMQTQEIAQWTHSPDNRLSIPVAPPIVLPDAKLPIHPYVLGAWLGDGTSITGSITCGDSGLFKNIESFGYELSQNRTPNRNSRLHTIKELSKWLTVLGLKKNKHIPAIYLRASVEQRLWLLRGLMDTDGHCNTRGTATFTNINKRLIDDVAELCQTLGLKPHTRQYFQTINGQKYPAYTVSFQAYQSFSPFALPRKTERCKKGARPKQRRFIVGCKQTESVPMRCIQVDRSDGLYLTGRALVPTHNSTIITFAKTIQDILIDPEVTAGIFSHTRPIAKGFLRQIKRELEANKKLYNLFPDILWENPQKQSPKWSEDDGIIVQRKSNPAAATVEAWGLVDGQPVSKHFSLLVFDDVVTRESCTTPDMIAKVNQSWELSLNLGTEGGRRRYIGTRYHYSDTYKLMLDRKAAIPRIHPATKDGRVNGKPVLMHPDDLAQKRREMGPFVFGAQMLLDPKADEVQGFKQEWLKFWPCNYFHNFNKIILCDPAGEKKKGSDYTVFWVLGLGEDMNYYAIDIVRDRLSLTERANVLFALHREFRPQFVGYEKYGMQSDIEHYQDRMNRDNYRFGITPFGGKVGKTDRIRSLIPMFEQGRIYIPDRIIKTNYQGVTEDMTQTFINEEYLAFPVASHDDMLDCLARITDPDCYREFPGKESVEMARASQEIDYDPFNYGHRGQRIIRQETDYNIFGR